MYVFINKSICMYIHIYVQIHKYLYSACPHWGWILRIIFHVETFTHTHSYWLYKYLHTYKEYIYIHICDDDDVYFIENYKKESIYLYNVCPHWGWIPRITFHVETFYEILLVQSKIFLCNNCSIYKHIHIYVKIYMFPYV
jgi:hypothetical protein